jgi:hypothetical protein
MSNPGGFRQPLQIKRVRIRALTANFYLNGHVAEVGEEGIVDYADVAALLKGNKVEILGDAPARTIPIRELQDPPPLRRIV